MIALGVELALLVYAVHQTEVVRVVKQGFYDLPYHQPYPAVSPRAASS